jgi:hypothetical protein
MRRAGLFSKQTCDALPNRGQVQSNPCGLLNSKLTCRSIGQAYIQGVVKIAVPQPSAHFNRRWQLSDGFVGIVWACRHRSLRGLEQPTNHNRQIMIRGDTVGFTYLKTIKKRIRVGCSYNVDILTPSTTEYTPPSLARHSLIRSGIERIIYP